MSLTKQFLEQGDVAGMFESYESDLENQAYTQFGDIPVQDYDRRFKTLLLKIYQSYEQILVDNQDVPKHEDEITKILVDRYLIKLDSYTFRREKGNNLGIVDIYIVEDFSNDKPDFIIECKVLNNTNLQGVNGKNAEYIKNGIYRFLNGHYFLDNNFYINAMVGFIIDDLDFIKNIDNLNLVSKNIIGEVVDITKEITLEEPNLYKSTYRTIREKNFTIYHLMMDFSKNIK
jgi:hypothetical protein